MFFFSSRRRHTRWTGDWSSDVCSSDLHRGGARDRGARLRRVRRRRRIHRQGGGRDLPDRAALAEIELLADQEDPRSEERRVGKEWRSRWCADPEKKNRACSMTTTKPLQ